MQPTTVLLPGRSHGWKSLELCSPWGHKESDTTEQLNFQNFKKHYKFLILELFDYCQMAKLIKKRTGYIEEEKGIKA